MPKIQDITKAAFADDNATISIARDLVLSILKLLYLGMNAKLKCKYQIKKNKN